MDEEYDIIVDSTGQVYQLKRDGVHTRTWHYRLTKEQEEALVGEIHRVLREEAERERKENIKTNY